MKTLDPSPDEILVRRAIERTRTILDAHRNALAITPDFPNRVYRVQIDFTIPPPARVCAMSMEMDFTI